MTGELATSSGPFHRLYLARIVLVVASAIGVLVVFWALYWTFYWSPFALMLPARRLVFWSQAVQTATGGLFCLLGAFVAVRAGPAVGVTYVAAFIVAQGLANGYLIAARAMLTPGDWKSPFLFLLTNWLAYATALRAVQTFPRALDAATVRRVSQRSWLPAVVWKPVEWLLDPYRVWSYTAVLLLLGRVGRVPPVEGLGAQVGQLVIILLALGTMAANYRAGDEMVRRRIYWFVLGAEFLLVARLLTAVSFVLIDWLGVGEGFADPRGLFRYISLGWVVRMFLWTGANLGLMACLVMAIFYRGALDPRLIVRGTAVASLGTGTLVFAFAAFEEFLSEMVADALDLEHLFVTAAAGAIVALAIRPLHEVLTRLVERWLPRTEVAPRDESLATSGPRERAEG